MVARMLATAALLSGFESRHLSKIKMGEISKAVANTLYAVKKYTKKNILTCLREPLEKHE